MAGVREADEVLKPILYLSRQLGSISGRLVEIGSLRRERADRVQSGDGARERSFGAVDFRSHAIQIPANLGSPHQARVNLQDIADRPGIVGRLIDAHTGAELLLGALCPSLEQVDGGEKSICGATDILNHKF